MTTKNCINLDKITKAEMLDQIIDSLGRAEMYGKDIDLLVALRVLYKLLVEEVKKDGKRNC